MLFACAVSFTPGFSHVSRMDETVGNRLNGFPPDHLLSVTRLKPGVNETKRRFEQSQVDQDGCRYFPTSPADHGFIPAAIYGRRLESVSPLRRSGSVLLHKRLSRRHPRPQRRTDQSAPERTNKADRSRPSGPSSFLRI